MTYLGDPVITTWRDHPDCPPSWDRDWGYEDRHDDDWGGDDRYEEDYDE